VIHGRDYTITPGGTKNECHELKAVVAVGGGHNGLVAAWYALCLGLIGAVLLADPDWPLRLAEPAWWALFSTGLSAYVVVRRRICD